MERLMPPYRGVSNHVAFADTPPGVVPYVLDAAGKPRARNFIPHSPGSKDRGTIGQRFGHDYLFPQQLGGPGGSPVQAVLSVARSSVIEGYRTGTCVPLVTGSAVVSGAIAGNYFQLDSVPSSDGTGTLDVSDDGGSVTNSVSASAVCPVAFTNNDGQTYYRCFVASNFTGADGHLHARILCFRDDTGATVWQYTINTASVDSFINSMCCSDDFLFVCTNAVIKVFRVLGDSTAYVSGDDAYSLVDTNTLMGYAQESIQAAVYKTVAGQEWLFVGFNGSEVGGLTSGNSTVITAGTPASCFRAGVMRFQINAEYASTTGPYQNANVLTYPTLGWGQTLDVDTGLADNSGDTLYDGFHGYFRVSERSLVTGHGCLVTGLCVNPSNGNVIVSRTNQGYGPNTTYPPDGLTYPTISIFCIGFDGTLQWEADTNSILEVGAGGYYNDIPTGAGDEPSLSAVSCNARGEVCAAGRNNAAGFGVFGIDASDGTLQWQATVQDTGTVRQAAMDYDRGDGHFVMGGDRNDDWDGGGVGDNRNIWKVHSQTGVVLRTFDWGANVSALTVSEMPDSSVVVGTDRI